MILHDPALAMRFSDYGIMLPISASRAERVLEYMDGNFVSGTRGDNMPFPGPVFDFASALSYLEEPGKKDIVTREDLERIHHADFIASLFGDGPAAGKPAVSTKPAAGGPVAGVSAAAGPGLSGLEKALLQAYELIDSQGRPR
ncbi:MAG: hypothetical protein LBP29_02100, partial [Treponema sp.]|nr:hypothetical protein [Treponema sp.]